MKYLQKIKDNWAILTGVVTIIVSLFMFGHNLLNQYDKLLETTETTQQMALKSVIWNDAIPDVERESACDVYLANGWNSYTKKECEKILERAEENGSFDY